MTKLKRDFAFVFCVFFLIFVFIFFFFRLCLISCRGTCYQSYVHVALVFAYIDGQAVRQKKGDSEREGKR